MPTLSKLIEQKLPQLTFSTPYPKIKPEKYQEADDVLKIENQGDNNVVTAYQPVQDANVDSEVVAEDLTPKIKRIKKSQKRSKSKINTDILTVDDKKASFVI